VDIVGAAVAGIDTNHDFGPLVRRARSEKTEVRQTAGAAWPQRAIGIFNAESLHAHARDANGHGLGAEAVGTMRIFLALILQALVEKRTMRAPAFVAVVDGTTLVPLAGTLNSRLIPTSTTDNRSAWNQLDLVLLEAENGFYFVAMIDGDQGSPARIAAVTGAALDAPTRQPRRAGVVPHRAQVRAGLSAAASVAARCVVRTE